MGTKQSKPDVFVVMAEGISGENCALAAFTTLKGALDHVPKVCYKGPMWIEKFRVDAPGYYEDDSEIVVWRSENMKVIY
jgi:hypothetical protein